jgi:flavorubredoxin
MKAVVVYESLWGNTASIARAIAEGIGVDASAMTTDQATGSAIDGADLIVAGAPLLGFNLPTEQMRETIGKDTTTPTPDLSHASMRSWLETLPAGTGRCAGFETRIWWSPGSAAKKISEGLRAKGYSAASKDEKFVVTGKYGPLKEGELERARQWGADLAQSIA